MSEGTILRRWVGRVRTKDAHAYAAYVEETGLASYAATPGNRGAQLALRDLGDGTTEVTTLSWWDGMASIRGFAGEEPELARYYPEDDRYLVERPERVEHHRVFARR